MEVKAVALYDFIGNTEADEIVFSAGDIILVTNMASTDGWWEGRLEQSGPAGFFPELYVQLMAPPDSASVSDGFNSASRPSPITLANDLSKPPQFGVIPDVGYAPVEVIPPPPLSQVGLAPVTPPYDPDVKDESVADEFAARLAEQLKTIGPVSEDTNSQNASITYDNTRSSRVTSIGSKSSFAEYDPGFDFEEEEGDEPDHGGARKSTQPIRKSINRFTHFVSSGAESFLLRNRPEEDIHVIDGRTRIIATEGGPRWAPKPGSIEHSISIVSHENRAKFAGTKHFVAYQIHDSKTDSYVWRRFKHFVWLHQVLSEKFSTICMPVLPEKQAQGRFAEEFIEQRKNALGRYLNRLGRHPVIRDSTVFHMFVTCEDDKAWKVGKRASERDPVQKGKFLQTIDIVDNQVPEDGDVELAKAFSKFTKDMKINTYAMVDAFGGFLFAAPTMQTMYNRLAFAMKRLIVGSTKDKRSKQQKPKLGWKSESVECEELTKSMDDFATILNEVSVYWDRSMKKSCIPIIEVLRDYESIIESTANAVDLHEKTFPRLKVLRKMGIEKTIDPEVLDQMTSRCSTLFNVSFAEMNRFEDEMVRDFSQILTGFVDSQIEFHETMLTKMKEARSKMKE